MFSLSNFFGIISDITKEIRNIKQYKQEKLISNQNIKTINGASILGSGDLFINNSHYIGLFTAPASLPVTAQPGDYADVDVGAGHDVERYIWDSDDTKWVKQGGNVSALTAADVKVLYESNADTNPFTDARRDLLNKALTNDLSSPSVADFNSFVTPGFYYVNAGTAANAPYGVSNTGNNKFGYLIVNSTKTGATLNSSVQFFIHRTSGSFFVRSFTDDTPAVWTPWKRISSDLENNNTITNNINLAAGVVFELNLTSSITLTLSNENSAFTNWFTLIINIGVVGSITWPNNCYWPGGTSPTLTTSKSHLVTGVRKSDGKWLMAINKNY